MSQFLFTSYLTPIWHESLANSSFVNPRLQLIRFCVQLASSCLLFLHRAVNVDSGLFLVPPVTNSVFGHSEYSLIEICSCVFSCLQHDPPNSQQIWRQRVGSSDFGLYDPIKGLITIVQWCQLKITLMNLHGSKYKTGSPTLDSQDPTKWPSSQKLSWKKWKEGFS